MSDNNHVEAHGAAIVHAVVDVQCAQCEATVTAGERAVQALGIPGLYCHTCGTSGLGLCPSAEAGDTDSVDIVEALRQEYQVRNVLGWPTPPAILVVDPDEGPVWRVGVPEDDGAPAMGRGALNGDRLEVTLYQPFQPAGAG